jgi:hypothetical protein
VKLRYKIVLVLLSVFIVWLIAIQFQTYKYPDAEDIGKRLSYLERVISGPLDADSEISLLQSESYEFMLFTYAYSTYALTNISIRDSLYKDRAVALIRESVLRVLDPQIYSSYGIGEPFIHSDTIPDYSVLYLGHLNLMLGCYRLLSGDDSFNRLNDNISESLFRRYERTPFLNLESYPSAIWIPDNTVAMASLKLHSYNTGSAYDVICKDWVEYAKAHYIDSRTGVLCSTVNPLTGEAAEEPRGSMLGWSIMFIYQFDPDFAVDLYNDYKENFSNELLIFRLFKERYNDSGINMGDIDSGPVFLGYSIPANEFALGGAILAGDYKTARKLERLINFGAATINENGEIRYKVRFVDMNISPMAEALVLNSLTITKWLKD